MNDLILEIIKNQPETAVKALLALRNISQKEFARRRGFSPSEVSKVIHGKRRNRRVQQAIAEELGIEYHVLFGENAE